MELKKQYVLLAKGASISVEMNKGPTKVLEPEVVLEDKSFQPVSIQVYATPQAAELLKDRSAIYIGLDVDVSDLAPTT